MQEGGGDERDVLGRAEAGRKRTHGEEKGRKEEGDRYSDADWEKGEWAGQRAAMDNTHTRKLQGEGGETGRHMQDGGGDEGDVQGRAETGRRGTHREGIGTAMQAGERGKGMGRGRLWIRHTHTHTHTHTHICTHTHKL
jgi:hypothetical protein